MYTRLFGSLASLNCQSNSSHLMASLTSLFSGQKIEIIQYIIASHVINFKDWEFFFFFLAAPHGMRDL